MKQNTQFLVMTQLLPCDLHELRKFGITLPSLSRFSTCFELELFGDAYYNVLLKDFYSGDFLYVDCSSAILLENDQFELYSFLCQLDRKEVFWHLTIPAFHLFLK